LGFGHHITLSDDAPDLGRNVASARPTAGVQGEKGHAPLISGGRKVLVVEEETLEAVEHAVLLLKLIHRSPNSFHSNVFGEERRN
jgi:hypothetical protein